MKRSKKLYLMFMMLWLLISCSITKINRSDTTYRIDFSEKYYYANYHLTNDSLNIYGFEHDIYHPKTILKYGFSEIEKNKINDFIKEIHLDQLKEEYWNIMIADGFEIFFEIDINNNFKQVSIKNCYIPVLANLVDYLNTFVPEERYKIKWYPHLERHNEYCE